jgi:hypothetical protein
LLKKVTLVAKWMNIHFSQTPPCFFETPLRDAKVAFQRHETPL